jgi:hypothetical protein
LVLQQVDCVWCLAFVLSVLSVLFELFERVCFNAAISAAKALVHFDAGQNKDVHVDRRRPFRPWPIPVEQ